MPVSAEPLARRLPPKAEMRSVEEVMLMRRIQTIKGNDDTFLGRSMTFAELPDELEARRATKMASASDIIKRAHRFQRGVPRRGAEAAYSRGHLTLRPLTGTTRIPPRSAAATFSGTAGADARVVAASGGGYAYQSDPLASPAQWGGEERRIQTAGARSSSLSGGFLSQSMPTFPFGLFAGDEDLVGNQATGVGGKGEERRC